MAGFEIDVDISRYVTDHVPDMRKLAGAARMAGVDLLDGFQIENLDRLNARIKVSGISEVVANWKLVESHVRGAATRRMRQAAREIYFASQNEAPFEFGTLRASGYIDEGEDESGGGAKMISVGYDPNEVISATTGESYLWDQHENPTYNHPTPGTKFHFLIDPYLAVSDRYPDAVQKDLSQLVEHVDYSKGDFGQSFDSGDDGDESESSIDSFWSKKR